MRIPDQDTIRRIRDIMGISDSPPQTKINLVLALAIDREEVIVSAKKLSQMEAYEKGRVVGAAEGRETAIKDIKLKYNLKPKDKTEYHREIARRLEQGIRKHGNKI